MEACHPFAFGATFPAAICPGRFSTPTMSMERAVLSAIPLLRGLRFGRIERMFWRDHGAPIATGYENGPWCNNCE
jgi:hypothetical protein